MKGDVKLSSKHKKWVDTVLKTLREKGYSQSDLARGVGVSSPTISETLRYGKGSNGLKTRINKFLAIKTDWS